MNKLWLIIQREYLTRVTRRSFWLATLLTPLGFVAFFVFIGLLFEYQGEDTRRIAVIDEGNILERRMKDGGGIYFKFVDVPLDDLLNDFDQMDYHAVLRIPPVEDLLSNKHTVYFYADKAPALDLEAILKNRIREGIRHYKIDSLALDPVQLAALETKVEVDPEPINDKTQDSSTITGAIGAAIGGTMGVFMYIVVFIYGMMVMRSVMEEKTSRIVEVMISSVRPFQLMLGKIVGVGFVGLSQIAIWALLIPTLLFIASLFMGLDSSAQMEMAQNTGGTGMEPEEAEAMVSAILREVNLINWWAIIPLFLIYFLGGYFLYAALFAAVGSAIGDDMGESQALTIPITIPVILAFYIMMTAIESPNSSLATWSSMFPLFSPIVMPARLAFSPPFWEVFLSISLLIAFAIGCVWLCARIYRVGILMYGKKVRFKTLGKWLFGRS